MKIINSGRFITNFQLEEVINLLGEEYKPELTVVFENPTEYVKYSIKNIFNIKSHEVARIAPFQSGQTVKFSILEDAIKIFLYVNIKKDKEDKQVDLIFDLVVELRLRYLLHDETNKKAKGTLELSDIITTFEMLNNETYKGLIYAFVSKFMNENSERLSEIMNWKEKYTYEE